MPEQKQENRYEIAQIQETDRNYLIRLRTNDRGETVAKGAIQFMRVEAVEDNAFYKEHISQRNFSKIKFYTSRVIILRENESCGFTSNGRIETLDDNTLEKVANLTGVPFEELLKELFELREKKKELLEILKRKRA